MRAKRWRVYAIELRDHPSLGARRVASLPHVYVGVTVRRPEARFEVHKEGGPTASDLVAAHGTRLLPELFAGIPRVETEDEARALEDSFARQVEGLGYTVHCGRGFFWDKYR